jgi:hypothetical protein
MGRGTNDFSLIPARFLITIGHLVATLMVSYSREEHLYASLGNEPSSSELECELLPTLLLLACSSFLVTMIRGVKKG